MVKKSPASPMKKRRGTEKKNKGTITITGIINQRDRNN
jgi:hypothetical protein